MTSQLGIQLRNGRSLHFLLRTINSQQATEIRNCHFTIYLGTFMASQQVIEIQFGGARIADRLRMRKILPIILIWLASRVRVQVIISMTPRSSDEVWMMRSNERQKKRSGDLEHGINENDGRKWEGEKVRKGERAHERRGQGAKGDKGERDGDSDDGKAERRRKWGVSSRVAPCRWFRIYNANQSADAPWQGSAPRSRPSPFGLYIFNSPNGVRFPVAISWCVFHHLWIPNWELKFPVVIS